MIDWVPADYLSPTWAKIRVHYRARLHVLREKNDGRLSYEETERLRGQIQEVKELLAFDHTQESR